MNPQPVRRPSLAAHAAAARRRTRRRHVILGIAVVVAVLAVGAWAVASFANPFTAPADSPAPAENASGTTFDSAENSATPQTPPAKADSIVMTLGGDKDTYVLRGEDYLEPGCHAYDPEEGNLSDVAIDGTVDTSTVGDYTVTYTAALSTGAQATAERTVHVVESFDDFAGNAETLPVLMYHYIYTEDDAPEHEDANYLLDTKFEKQLAYLVENNYYYPSYQEVRAFAQDTHTLPARSVVLTFDDGQEGFLKYGIPLLEKYEVPGTSFLICSQKKTKSKLKKYASPYVSFQSHSYNMHRDGSDVGRGGIIHALTTKEIVKDLKKAQKILGTTEAFAYPYGDNNENAWAAMEKAGVLCAFTIVNRRVEPGDPPEALPRVRIAGEYAQEGFEYLVEPNGGEQ